MSLHNFNITLSAQRCTDFKDVPIILQGEEEECEKGA
jgi:hypothetical protein